MAEARIGRRQIGIITALIVLIVGPMYAAWQLDISAEREAIRGAQMDYREMMEEQMDFLQQQLRFCAAAAKDNGDGD